MDVKIEPSWKQVLQTEFDKEYFVGLTDFCAERIQNQTNFSSGATYFQCFRSLSVR